MWATFRYITLNSFSFCQMSWILPEVVMEKNRNLNLGNIKPKWRRIKLLERISDSLNSLWRSLSTTQSTSSKDKTGKRKGKIKVFHFAYLMVPPLITSLSWVAVPLCSSYSDQSHLRTWVRARITWGAKTLCNSPFFSLQPMTNLVFFNIQALPGPF